MRVRVSSAVNDRMDAIASLVLDCLDEPQQRVRTVCAQLCETEVTERATLVAMTSRVIQLDAELGALVKRADDQAKRGGLRRLAKIDEDSLKTLRAVAREAACADIQGTQGRRDSAT